MKRREGERVRGREGERERGREVQWRAWKGARGCALLSSPNATHLSESSETAASAGVAAPPASHAAAAADWSSSARREDRGGGACAEAIRQSALHCVDELQGRIGGERPRRARPIRPIMRSSFREQVHLPHGAHLHYYFAKEVPVTPWRQKWTFKQGKKSGIRHG